MEKQLGKITRAEFGFGGYQEVQLGFSFSLGSDGWVTGDFWGYWACDPGQGTQWTDAHRRLELGNTAMRVKDLLAAAKVQHLHQLVGVPVEVTFDGLKLSSWRILTEVLGG